MLKCTKMLLFFVLHVFHVNVLVVHNLMRKFRYVASKALCVHCNTLFAVTYIVMSYQCLLLSCLLFSEHIRSIMGILEVHINTHLSLNNVFEQCCDFDKL